MEKTLIYSSSGRIDELKNIQPRKILTWIVDSPECFKCHSQFTWYYRKHHCRSCGRVFCGLCSNHMTELNTEYEKYPRETMDEIKQYTLDNSIPIKFRVCKKCYLRNKQIKKIWTLIKVFELTTEINLLDLRKMSMVCHMWHQLYIYYISKFRELQYILPTYKPSQ